ncbi:unnamed protein product, partial [Durusdinium trenchii]
VSESSPPSTSAERSERQPRREFTEEEKVAWLLRWKSLLNDLDYAINGLFEYEVRNCKELASWLQVAALENHRPHAEKCFDNVDAKASVLLSEVDALEFTSFLEEQKHQAQPIEVDVRDAKRRITVAKGPKKKTPQPPCRE